MLKKTFPPLLFWQTTPTATPELSPASSSSDTDSDRDMDSASTSQANLAVPSGAFCPLRPSLADVLSNTAPPPYTLSSFMAYLSQNHCLETLEFSLEAKRYRESYESLAGQMGDRITTAADSPECGHLHMLWHRLLTAYIFPGSPREINLPSEVRDGLLQFANSPSPPSPQTLDPAVKLVHELMEESIFLPFLNSHSAFFGRTSSAENVSVVPGPGLEDHAWSSGNVSSKGKRVSPQSSTGDLLSGGGQSTRSSNFPALGAIPTPGKAGRSVGPVSTASGDTGSVALTDDSGSWQSSSPIPSPQEPVTPPITPPSGELAGSPKSRSDNPWKKMGMRLGLKKRSATRVLEE